MIPNVPNPKPRIALLLDEAALATKQSCPERYEIDRLIEELCALGAVAEHVTADEIFGGAASEFDLVVPRSGANSPESEFLAAGFAAESCPVINALSASRIASCKAQTFQALKAKGVPVPAQRIVSNNADPAELIAELGERIVVKDLTGSQGSGVSLVEGIHELATELASRLVHAGDALVCQRAFGITSDYRLPVVGGVVLPMVRRDPPEHGDTFKSNASLGGVMTLVEESEEAISIAAGAVQALGLDLAGVDLMKDDDGNFCCIEVNHSFGFRSYEATTNINVARRIAHYLLRRIAPRQARRLGHPNFAKTYQIASAV